MLVHTWRWRISLGPSSVCHPVQTGATRTALQEPFGTGEESQIVNERLATSRTAAPRKCAAASISLLSAMS
eukprot:6208473-Pleurochrysis_carterae.AAC.1